MRKNYHHILIVDDDDDDRYIIDHSFRQLHWEDHIKVLDSGEGMFRHLGSLYCSCAYPDLILLDYHMPRMGAEEILARLKGDEHYRDIKVVVYSTEMNDTIRRRLEALGAEHCYAKALDLRGSMQLAATLRSQVQPAVA